MTDADLATLRQQCTDLAAAVAQPWSWDGRFNAALATYEAPDDEHVSSAASAVLTATWTSATIGDAPAAAQALAKSLGGLRAGQRLMTSPADGSVLLFGVFWPWGGGGRTSIRVGCVVSGPTADRALEVLRGAFGL
jgi:hypothetical protein